MKKLITKYKKLIIFLILPYMAFVLMGVITIDYSLVAPGGINPVTDVITIDNQTTTFQNINTVYVYAPTRITIIEYFLGKLDRNFTVAKNSRYNIASREDERKAGKIQKDTSITNSLIVAYEAASLVDPSIKIKYEYRGQIIDMVYSYTDTDVRIGDVVIGVDGQPVDCPSAFTHLIRSSSNKEVELEVIRDGKNIKYTLNLIKYVGNDNWYPGFSHYEYYEITEANPRYQIEPSKTSGPSGGLMQALSIYANLLKKDLAKGKIVCGTGTLEKDENDIWIVGQIGGAYQKVIASYRADADVFFVPDILNRDDNYEEAFKAYKTLKNPKMTLVPVRTFADALAYFEGN